MVKNTKLWFVKRFIFYNKKLKKNIINPNLQLQFFVSVWRITKKILWYQFFWDDLIIIDVWLREYLYKAGETQMQ